MKSLIKYSIICCLIFFGLICCKHGAEQDPVEKTVYFSTPANVAWLPDQSKNVNFEMVLKVVTTNSSGPIVYPGGPIYKAYTTDTLIPFHPDPISEKIVQPEGATAYVINLDIATTECGGPIHGGAAVDDPEKGAKGRWNYISERIAFPHGHLVPANQLLNYITIQCP